MSVKNTIKDIIYYTKCQVRLVLNKYVLRPKIVKISGVKLKANFLELSSDVITSLYRGHYERSEQEIISSTLSPTDIVLELGAGIGFISSFIGKSIGEKRVTVVEANPELINIISNNHKLNDLSISVENCVAALEDGFSTFYVKKNFWASSLSPTPDSKEVEVRKKYLGGMINDIGATYLVIDIEGGESALLSGEQPFAIPSSVTKICIELHPTIIGDLHATKIINNLLNQGFIIHIGNVRSSANPVLYFNR